MSGEDQSELKLDKVPLPPPMKRRDHHLRKCREGRVERVEVFWSSCSIS